MDQDAAVKKVNSISLDGYEGRLNETDSQIKRGV